jgi:acyl-CoA oxidase
MSQAYLERVVLEQFQETIQDIKDKKAKKVMLKLYQLYALSQIEKIKDGISRMVIWAVKQKPYKMVNQLCWEIRPDAVSLVKAFDIPDSCLAAPIAL